ncbi:MAG TPA: hypothetical protein DCR35_10985 [Runella sp.]|nr:hypothetical protein [Runella sp.]HAO49780.1 hypothetical protein [Runella sp.]
MNKYTLILTIFLTGILSACGTQSNEQTSTNSTSTANENGRAAQLPETTANVNVAKPAGINRDQFDAALNSPKLVLIDFYADWCAPCKKMTPYLEEIKTEMGDKVEVVRINADDSAELASQLSIEGLPTVLVFKNKTMVWKNVGYIGKEELVKHLQ